MVSKRPALVKEEIMTSIGDESEPPVAGSTQNQSPQKTRGRTDPAWGHCKEIFVDGDQRNKSKLTSEMRLFRQAHGDFGRLSAKSDCRTMAPDEWWINYGSNAPNLQKLAIRILSQTCSSSGCERNWSMFEHIHSKKRNRLEHQRLNGLVYVHYNLRLEQRNYFKKRKFDPIDFEKFGIYGNWVLEEEPPNLMNDELEAFRRDLAACNIQCNENYDELHIDDLEVDIDDGGNDGNENESRGNANEDFSMTETPSWVQCEGVEEFMSDTPAWMRSNPY